MEPVFSNSLTDTTLVDLFYISVTLFIAVLMHYTFIWWVSATSCDHRCHTHCVALAYYFRYYYHFIIIIIIL
jgi:hypothetical protein